MSKERIPPERIEDLCSRLRDLQNRLMKIELRIQGRCPECLQHVGNWRYLPHETWAAAWKERGIDPSTGHKISCTASEWEIGDEKKSVGT